MKMKATILACMIVMSGLFVGTVAQAVPYSGTIVFSDLSGHVQDYFEPSDWVVFDVTVLDGGVPLQGQTVDVVIVGDGTIGQVFSTTYDTNTYGQFTGDHTDGAWYTRSVGFYTMYVNYSGNAVVSDTFRIYNPVPWSASGWTEYDGVTTQTFTEDQQVTVRVVALDQYGNPVDGGYGDVWYEVTKGTTVFSTVYLNTNNSGGAVSNFNTWNHNQNQFGRFMVTVFNDALPPQAIGFFNFTVVLPDRAVISLNYFGLDRTVFREGETVGYSIELFHQNTMPYDSDNHAARVLLFKDGMEDPLRNNTLNTDSDCIAYSNNFYTIGYDESFRGTYTVQVYNATWNVIGTAIFMVIEIQIGMLPEKTVYAQGDTVTITVATTLEEAYRVRISDSAGVQVPTATWNVPAGTTDWWKDFTFPETLPDGWYSVDVLMDSLLLTSRQFELKKITLHVMLSQAAFVPGQSGTAFWRAVNNHDGGPISVTGDDSELNYIDDDWDYSTKDLADISGSSGSIAFTVPKDAMLNTAGDIEIEARDTASHSDTGTAGFQVRPLRVDANTDRGSYLPGDTIFLTLNSRVEGTNYPVPGVDIKLTMRRDGTMVGSSWTVRSNSAGTVSTTYQMPSDAAKGIWVLVINATFDANNNIKYNGTKDITLNTDPIVSMDLQQVRNFYMPGEQVTVPYRVMKNGIEVTTAKVTFEAYITQTGAPMTVALGFGSNGEISFTLPSNVEGTLTIMATATTAEGLQASDALNNIPVSSGQIVMYSLKSTYMPGENVTWKYVLSTDTETSALFRITDPDGLLLAQGTPENGTITFQLPSEFAVNPTARVYVTGANGRYFASNTAQVFKGYVIEYRILSNSYSPGDVMKINYTIRKVGEIPDNVNGFRIQINIMGQYTKTVWVVPHFGVLEYDIPDDISDGKHLVILMLDGSANMDIQSVIIDSNAGELAHGTILGMNASGFLALVFALVALIIGIIGLMKIRKMGSAEKPDEPEKTEETLDHEKSEPVHESSYQYPPPSSQQNVGGPGEYPPPQE
jgi:hypothetical protein